MSTIAEENQEASAPAAAQLGVERYVQFAFIGAAVMVFWVLDKAVYGLWDLFDEPNPNIVTPVAALLAVVGAFVSYRRPNVHKFAHDVADELSKVDWPTRQEAWSHTVVVLVVSLIAAVILGLFDLSWSKLTDFIYGV
ncbi:MAG: preprotein translocase subunit SecE [Polyangiales bacterium]